MNATPSATPEQELLNEIVLDYQMRRLAQAEREARHFVHYTSAENALSIINNREVWLRNASVMNDFSEIDHGESCLAHVLLHDTETKARSESVLNSVDPGLHAHLANLLLVQDNRTTRRRKTFLLSLSEHGPERIVPGTIVGEGEEKFGRLSMWRAYGNTGGAALVFKGHSLLVANDTVDAYLSPVFYGEAPAFALLWEQMLTRIERKIDRVRDLPTGALRESLVQLAELTCMTCKHPGFAEEREWRITYAPDLASEPADDEECNVERAIKREIRAVNGIPQRIYKIPLWDDPASSLRGTALKDILHSVIIGPTQYPAQIFEALVVALARVDVPNPAERVKYSFMPIRT